MEKSVSGPVEVAPVIPLVSVISSDLELIRDSAKLLETCFGEVDLISGSFDFDLSDYYEPEMGPHLQRVWYSFRILRDPSMLPKWKHDCFRMENDMLDSGGGRQVNIDPGYMDFGKLVLASFKEAPDKIYMGRGVWAHTCLRYGHGAFSAPDHSFPDFMDGRFDEFLHRVRRNYRLLLRSAGE